MRKLYATWLGVDEATSLKKSDNSEKLLDEAAQQHDAAIHSVLTTLHHMQVCNNWSILIDHSDVINSSKYNLLH